MHIVSYLSSVIDVLTVDKYINKHLKNVLISAYNYIIVCYKPFINC